MTGSYIREHCRGFRPECSKVGRFWEIRCPGCGKQIRFQSSQQEARLNWAAQCECEYRMRGETND